MDWNGQTNFELAMVELQTKSASSFGEALILNIYDWIAGEEQL